MSGIAALLSYDEPVLAESLDRALAALAHRGRDGSGSWMAPDRRVALGHRRLATLDLPGGSEPIANEDEQIHIIVNGEFYEFERIRQDLEDSGHRFRTRSDSEVALHLYEEMGVECLERLRGEFALILWDEKKKSLFAARDRFGIKPLFYFHGGGRLYLASEAKALFAAGVEASWDAESVFQNVFLAVNQDRSLFKDIRQIPPGCYLLATRDSVRIERYWDLDYPRADQQPTRPEGDWIEEIRFRLAEATRIRLRADVPVGCYLSGGVDSSSVMGMASAAAPGKIAAFTVAFEGAAYDESAVAGRTAAHLGAGFETVPLTNSDFAHLFSDAVWHAEMVQFNAQSVARFALSQAVEAAGFKAVLGGDGGDELFAGLDLSRAALLSPGTDRNPANWARLRPRLRRPEQPAERLISTVSPKLTSLCKLMAFPPVILQTLAGKLIRLQSLLSRGFLEMVAGRDPYQVFLRQFNRPRTMSGREPVKQLSYLWLKSVTLNHTLAAERLDMAHSVAVRLPFLDHKFFELTRAIPASLLGKGIIGKQLLRDAARPFVTDEVYSGAKHPFFAPPSLLSLPNPMFQLIQDVLRSRTLAGMPFFDPESVAALLDRIPAMDWNQRRPLDSVLFMMASMCILHERYGL